MREIDERGKERGGVGNDIKELGKRNPGGNV